MRAPRPITADNPPRQYLSTSGGLWRVIDQGMPVCADKQTRHEAEACAVAMRLQPSHLWDGDAGTFSPLPVTR